MTIDEAIEQYANAECGTCPTLFCEECVKGDKRQQIAEWLEELKELRKIKEDYSKGMQTSYATFMYNKALDDFVKFANTMPVVEEEDGEIRPMWLEEMAERLKVGGAE